MAKSFFNKKDNDFTPKSTKAQNAPFMKLEPGETAIVKVLSSKKSTYKGKEQTVLSAIDEDGKKINISDAVLIRMWQEDVIEANEILRVTCQGWKDTPAGKYRLLEVESAGIDDSEE